MKNKLIITFLLIFCGGFLRAQYINTDSIQIVPGFFSPVSLSKVDKFDLNATSVDYDKNLSTGAMLLQFSMPGEGKIISRFGPRSGRIHTGTDIKMQKGDTVYAAFNGSVTRSQYYYGYGNLVVIQHIKGLETYYGHLSKLLVKNGGWVSKGEPLGLAGATGRATTSHLHFEIRENNKSYDPELVFDFENNMIRNDVERLETLAALQEELKPQGYSVNMPILQNYIVRSGDSLYKISRRARTSIQALCQLNQLSESSVLQIGQIIKVF